MRENLANRVETSRISVNSCPIRAAFRIFLTSLPFVQHVLMLFSNRNEFLRDSSRIEPIAPNIRNDIVSEWGMTRGSSRLEKKKNETSRIPPKKEKNQFVAIRGQCGIGV